MKRFSRILVPVFIGLLGGGLLLVGTVFAQSPTDSIYDDLVVWWDFEEESGTRYDSHINGLDLTDNNTVGRTAGLTNTGYAAFFSRGNLEYLSIVDPDLLDIDNRKDLTFAVWIRASDTISKLQGSVYGKYNYNDGGFLAHWNGAYYSPPKVLFIASDANLQAYVGSESTYCVETYCLLMGWWISGTGELGVSINNETPVTETYAITPIQTDLDFEVGRVLDTHHWDGAIDSLAIWHRQLDESEKSWLYNDGSGQQYPVIPTPTPLPSGRVYEYGLPGGGVWQGTAQISAGEFVIAAGVLALVIMGLYFLRRELTKHWTQR